MERTTSERRGGRKTKEQVAQDREAREAAFNQAVATKLAEILPDAISTKIQELLPQLGEQLAAARELAGTAGRSSDREGDKALLEGLAHAMAKAADPGNKRRIVSPEVMKQREEATQRMNALLIDFHAQARMPVYRVLNKVFLAETLVDPQYQDPQSKEMKDQEINWNKVPNQALEPQNDEAKAVFKEFLISIGSQPRDITKDPAPWVMSAGQLLRGKPGAQRAAVGEGGSEDPRRIDAFGKPIRKTVRVLGSVADPAVVGP